MELVPDATYRLDRAGHSDFAAEIFHVGVDRAIVEIVFVAHDIMHEVFATHDDIRVVDEVVYNLEFCLSCLHRDVVDEKLIAVEIERDTTMAEHSEGDSFFGGLFLV